MYKTVARQTPSPSLSYYESEIPNDARAPSPSPSTSDSDYSYDSDSARPRRTQTPSKDASDRRRVAIVQTDSSIRQRRGHKSSLAGLALVAPPDAALRTYTHLTPPSTAPVSGQITAVKTHHRSSSDAPTSTTPHGLLSPPQSGYPSARVLDLFSPIVTPEIGQGKEIHIPVAAPVVVNLDKATAVHTTKAPPPRFNVHVATPPPPRPPRLHSPSPSRPPRDTDPAMSALEPVREKDDDDESSPHSPSLTKSRSVHRREAATATLASSTDTASLSSASSVLRTPPSSSLTSTPKSSLDEPTRNKSDDHLPSVQVVSPTRSQDPGSDTIDHTKFDLWLKDNPHLIPTFDDRRSSSLDMPRTDYSLERSISPMSADHTGEAPSPPPKSFRHSISNNLKRFSTKSARRSSAGTPRSSRTPSPSIPLSQEPTSNFQKTRSMNPAALYCHEVYSQTTTLQRCAIYASKINELYLYDCGLADWLGEMKDTGSQAPRAPSSRPFAPKPRHISRSSMVSEATFPRRPDATTATDLSAGAYNDIAPGMPPSLPYPSLAMNPPRSAPPSNVSATPPSSMRSLAPSLSTSSKGTGFFASLGRKASLSKKERPIISGPAPTSATIGPPGRIIAGGLAKNNANGSSGLTPTKASISRPIQITQPPTIPGGPRAPRRAQRSQTFMSVVSPTQMGGGNARADDALGRRPSLFNIHSNQVLDIKPDPEFKRQVDQLAALIPRADKNVLAGYLRHAGQDLLAIGQYLEDERMGTIKQY